MNMSSVNGQENGDGYMSVDQTFHTPSFGDEEFDIPPISLPPTSSSDSNPNDLYGSSQPLSHQQQPQQSNQHIPQQHSPQQQQQHQQQPQQQALPPCSQSMGMGDPSGVMTSVASTPSPTMSMMDGGPPPQQQYSGPPMHGGPAHHDMYMVQIGPGAMLPPQSVQFQMQQYNVPTSYASSPMQQQPQHMHPQQHLHHQQPQHHMGMQHPLQHQFHHSPQPQQQHHQQQHHSQLLPPSSILALQLGAPRVPRPGSVGSSPPGSNQTSPGLETSEDSDDSGHLSQLMGGIKRPSPEPIERPPSGGKTIKKPKVQKKKKKRDPNEPQKPVSAYALFFRDTQAAIKGQNPNASFGEVSKIVASMWDSLDIEHKNIYKKKTEAAKKEYLKALAAYRASLVSKAANDQSDNIYGNGNGVSTTSATNGSVGQNQQLSPLQKKSPLLTSLMEGTPINTLQNMTQPQPLLVGQAAMGSGSNMAHHHQQQQHMIPQHMSHPGQPPPQMFNHMAPNGHMMPAMAIRPPPLGSQMMTLNHSQPGGLNTNHSYSPNMMPSSPQMSHPGQSIAQGGGMMAASQIQNCLRNSGSTDGQEWDGQEYCSNNCVVSHCRDVYTTWVSSRQTPNSYASVK